jgi:ABC-type nitrate/sulfonate/bicarbonate transport system permease component
MTMALGDASAPLLGAESPARPTTPGDRRLLSTFNRVATPVLGIAIVLALWTIGGRAGWANGMVVTPAEAVRPIVGATRNVYGRATQATVWSALRGLMIGSLLAFVAAVAAASIPPLRRSIARLAAIANAAPWVAVAPCLLVILGRDRGPVAVAAVAVFFYVFVSTTVGLGAAPSSAHDFVTASGGNRWLRVRVLQLPACWPSVVDGLRLAAPASMAGAIFGEWYGAPRGLGVLLLGAMQTGRPDRLWAASLLSATCGLVAFGVLAAARWALTRRYGSTIAQSVETVGRRRRVVRTALVEIVTAVALAALLVTAWWAWIELADVSPLVVPRPLRVWRDLHGHAGIYLHATGATLTTAAVAFVIGAGVGFVTAALAARVRLFAGMAVPVIVVLAATPLVALFPLFARILGYQPTTVRVLAATMVFFPVFVYTRSGLAAASGPPVDVMHALGASRGSSFRLVALPGAVPHIASGCRIAAGSAVIAAVVGETLIGRVGLGVQFSYSYRLLQLPRAFGAAICIVVVSVLVFTLAGAAERAIHARWR